MADEAEKTADSAEKAYADAAAGAVAPKPVVEAKPVAKSKPAAPKIVAKPATAKPAPKKPAPVKAAVKKVSPKKKAPVKTIKAKPAAVVTKPTPSKKPAAKPAAKKTKEPIMAKTPDFMKSVTDAMSDMQSKAKEAYDKGTAMTGEATEFAKGNVEAIVEAGKIYSAGLQDLGKTYVEDAKGAFETLTGDMKEIAAIKSPTELFQLQGKLMRRNFDAMVAFGSKSSETMVKLANDTMAPLSSRMSLAAEKVSKVA